MRYLPTGDPNTHAPYILWHLIKDLCLRKTVTLQMGNWQDPHTYAGTILVANIWGWGVGVAFNNFLNKAL